MLQLRQIEQTILANGTVDSQELDALRLRVYDGDKVGRTEADLLVELHKRVQRRSPPFERFFYRAIKDHVLTDGWIDGEVVLWLRRIVLAGGEVDDAARKLLHELRGEARMVSREFEKLFDECMKLPQDQHTCG